jgi:hypothetical protein
MDVAAAHIAIGWRVNTLKERDVLKYLIFNQDAILLLGVYFLVASCFPSWFLMCTLWLVPKAGRTACRSEAIRGTSAVLLPLNGRLSS